MSRRDFYEILGVSRDSSLDQIKKAYRKAALKYHPDKNPGDREAEEKFKEASRAYQVLSEPNSRERYNQFGHAAFDGQFDGFTDFTGFAEDIFGDLFGAFFGGSSGTRRGRRGGRDLKYSLEITLEEAAQGIEKQISIPRPVPCEGCNGSGGRDGKAPTSCKQCGGSGQMRFQQGFFTLSRPCSICSGTGQVVIDPCPHCGGGGKKQKEAKLAVKIPAGIDSGQRLKLRGEGEQASGSGTPGDLYVEIVLKPHEFLQRHETELVSEVPVTFTQATLGSEVRVRTIDGEALLKVPPGTPSGKVFRLKGKGIVNIQTGQRGDHHVRTYVYVPQTVTQQQRDLLEKLAAIEGQPVPTDSRSFLDKVKEFFD